MKRTSFLFTASRRTKPDNPDQKRVLFADIYNNQLDVRDTKTCLARIKQIPSFSIEWEPEWGSYISGENLITLVCHHSGLHLIKDLMKMYGNDILQVASSTGLTPLHALISGIGSRDHPEVNMEETIELYQLMVEQNKQVVNTLHTVNGITSPLSFCLQQFEKCEWTSEPYAHRMPLLVRLTQKLMTDGALLCPVPFSRDSEHFHSWNAIRNVSDLLSFLPLVISSICSDYVKEKWYTCIPDDDQIMSYLPNSWHIEALHLLLDGCRGEEEICKELLRILVVRKKPVFR
jgi:hypothetical protein